MPNILFVCIHNAGRSQMAAALTSVLSGSRVHVRSAGSQPASDINPAVVAAMDEIGIDLSQEMLDKAVERVQTLAMPNVTLKVMDATSMDFADGEFDSALATYTISAVPDPVAVLREMRRVVKPGGNLVLLNHFRSEQRVAARFEDLVAPVCTRLGWKSNLKMTPLLKSVGLVPETVIRVNMFNGWRLVKCVNRK